MYTHSCHVLRSDLEETDYKITKECHVFTVRKGHDYIFKRFRFGKDIKSDYGT